MLTGEERPQADFSSGSELFCVLQPRTLPSLVDSIVNRVKWGERVVWGGVRNYILCEVACLEVWQGDRDFQLMQGIMSESHLTPPQTVHVSGMSG